MKLLNLFFKNREEIKANENTLDLKSSSSKKKVDEFIKCVKPITEKRKSAFNTLFSFALDGEQWSNDEELNLDGETPLTFNFSENYLDRYMARLFPRNQHTGVLEVGVKVYEDDKHKKEKQEKLILDFNKREKLIAVILEQGINYLCGGAGLFYYPADSITKKARLFSLNPTDCYIGWKNNQLVQFAYKEYVGDNKYNIIYWDLNDYIFIDGKTNKITIEKNKYNFIPVSWIPNNPKPHKHEGKSKINALYSIDRAYNFAATDLARRVANNTEPHMVIMSDNVAIEDIDRGKKKKTKLAKGDDMKYLELKEGAEVINYLNLLEGKMKSKAGIIDSGGSVKTHISGVSLSFQYSDMMDLIGYMRIVWDNAFREMNNAILTYQFGDQEYKTDPVYQPFINIDSKQRVDEYAIMIDKEMISRRDAIDEIRGVESPDEKIKNILEEKKLFNKLNEKQDENNQEKNKDDER